MIHGALSLRLICNKDVFSIKVKDPELFGVPMRHGRMTIINYSIPTGNDMPLQNARTRKPLCRGFDDLQFGYNRVTHPCHLG